jgi:hypothetical protein
MPMTAQNKVAGSTWIEHLRQKTKPLLSEETQELVQLEATDKIKAFTGLQRQENQIDLYYSGIEEVENGTANPSIFYTNEDEKRLKNIRKSLKKLEKEPEVIRFKELQDRVFTVELLQNQERLLAIQNAVRNCKVAGTAKQMHSCILNKLKKA